MWECQDEGPDQTDNQSFVPETTAHGAATAWPEQSGQLCGSQEGSSEKMGGKGREKAL